MSFSIEEVELEFNSKRISTRYNLYDHLIYWWYEDKKSNSFYSQGGRERGRLGFNIEKAGTSDSIYTIKFKKVKTEGPIVGFFGFYLDLESGHFVLGGHKRNEFISLYDFYGFIESKGVVVNPNMMKSLIERYKMGEIGIEDIVDELNKPRGKGGSVIADLIELGIGEEDGEVAIIGDLFEPLEYLSAYLYDLYKATEEINVDSPDKYYITRKDLVRESIGNGDEDGADMGLFINSFMETKDISKFVEHWYEEFHNVDVDSIEEFLEYADIQNRKLSTMLHTSKMGRGSELGILEPNKDKMDRIKGLTETETTFMNTHDIVEEYKDDSLLEIDSLLFTQEDNVEKSLIHKITDKIGIKEYISGAKLSHHFSRKLKYSNKIADYINRMTSQVYMDIQIGGKGTAVSLVTYSFKKMVKFYQKGINLVGKVVK